MVTAAKQYVNAHLEEKIVLDPKEVKGDKFKAVHPNTDWMTGMDHGERIGLGKKEYELVRLK